MPFFLRTAAEVLQKIRMTSVVIAIASGNHRANFGGASWRKPKGLLNCCYISVCRLFVRSKLAHVHLLQNHWAKFSQTWHEYLGEVIQICSNEEPGPLQMGEGSHKIAKIGWAYLTIFFSRTTGSENLKVIINQDYKR